MKTKIFAILLMITMFLPVTVFAEEEYNYYQSKTEEIVQKYNIEFEKIKEYPFETLWDVVKNTVKKSIEKPFVIFYQIFAVILLTSFVNFLTFDNNKQAVSIVNIVAVLILFYNIFNDFVVVAEEIGDKLVEVKDFITTFIPVLAGIAFASGEFVSSTVYSGFFVLSVAFVADFCVKYILPSINLFMAVGVTASVSKVVNLKPICDFYSKTVKIAMTASVSLLCFVLSLQTAISQGKDTLALKAGKMIVTSTVPIIGSALEGAVGSVYASMGVLKGFCGIAGIAAIINIFLPTVIRLVISWIGYSITAAVSTILENEAAANILDCFKEVMEIFLSMVVLFMVLLIFSITIMIKAVGA